jgi:ribonuclease BN (tRNA processing enzyme)
MGRGADLLVLECSFPNERKIQGHLTPKLAGKVAKEAEAKKLVLTHFYPPCDEADIISQCREEFSGEIVLAEDLMVLTL